MKLKACAVFLLVSMALAAQALAFDGKRKGFILGGGIGGAYLSYDLDGPSASKFSLATNIKIGYAPSESFEIYFLNSVSWFVNHGYAYVMGSGNVGVTKYLKPEGKGVFLFAGAGLSLFAAVPWGGLVGGLGLIGGVGYDLGRHRSIQVDVVYTDMKEEMISSVSFRVTINFLAF